MAKRARRPLPQIFVLIVWGLAGALVSTMGSMGLLQLVVLGVLLVAYLLTRGEEVAGGIGAFVLGAGLGLLVLSRRAADEFEPVFRWLGFALVISGAAWLIRRRIKRQC